MEYATTSTQTGSDTTHGIAIAQPPKAQTASTQDASCQTMSFPFRYCDLPQEIRLNILTFTDLVVPGNVIWWDPDDKYTLDDPWEFESRPCTEGNHGPEDNCHPWNHRSCKPLACQRRCCHSPSGEEGQMDCYRCKHYMCPFIHCRHEGKEEKPCRVYSEKGRCTCIWSPPTAIFLINRTTYDLAQEVFFKHNLFHVRYRVRGPFRRPRFERRAYIDYFAHERRYWPAADIFLGANIIPNHVACKSLRRLALDLMDCEGTMKKRLWRERLLAIPTSLMRLESLSMQISMPEELQRTNLQWSSKEFLMKVRQLIHQKVWNLDTVGIRTPRDKDKAVEHLSVHLVLRLVGIRSITVMYRLHPKYAFCSPRLIERIVSGHNGWTHDVVYGTGESAGYYTESIHVRLVGA